VINEVIISRNNRDGITTSLVMFRK